MRQELIHRMTLVEMVNAWHESCAEIRAAFAFLVSAEERLKAVFKPNSYLFSLNKTSPAYREYQNPERLLKELKMDAWKALVDRMEIRRLLSVKKWEELNNQLQTGEGLPDIEVDLIMDMVEGLSSRLDTYLEEAVQEVFEFLRPRNGHYKTNSQYEIGKKVVLGWCVRPRTTFPRESASQGFGVSNDSRTMQQLRALDNVFHLMDGKGIAPTHNGPLVNAIDATDFTGQLETEYFKGKCCLNRNLHLEFRRMDLVAKLNAVAGGARLRNAPPTVDSQEA